MRVVDDLLADVDRRAVVRERQLHRVDGPFDAGAVAARRGQEDALDHRLDRSHGLFWTNEKAGCFGGSVQPASPDCSPRTQGQVAAVRIAQCRPSYFPAAAGTMGRSAYLFKRGKRAPPREFAANRSLSSDLGPVTSEQQALYLNVIPLLALGVIYLAAAVSLVPGLRRDRREPERTLALGFACGGAAAVVFALLILRDREPLGGNGWLGFAAILVAALPALAFFARYRRARAVGPGARGGGRSPAARGPHARGRRPGADRPGDRARSRRARGARGRRGGGEGRSRDPRDGARPRARLVPERPTRPRARAVGRDERVPRRRPAHGLRRARVAAGEPAPRRARRRPQPRVRAADRRAARAGGARPRLARSPAGVLRATRSPGCWRSPPRRHRWSRG